MAQQRLKTVFVLTAFWCAAGVAGAADISLQEAIEKSAAVMVEKLPAKTPVAVVAMEAESENLAAFIMDEVASVLGNDIEVVNRNKLDFVLKELHLQSSGLVDDKTAVQVGKQLGAKYVITGQLIHLGDSYRYRLTAINTESAVQEANSRFTVKDDGAFKKMLAALNKNKQVTREAKSAVTEKTMPQTAGTFLDRGMLFASRGDYDLAIEDFTEAIRLDGKSALAYVLRGKALMASFFNVNNHDNDFNTITFAGLKQGVKKERIDEAIADYNQAIKLDPQFAMAYLRRGHAYSEKGDNDRALADFNQAIKIDPNFVNAYINRGNVYRSKGDYDRALADFNQAIKIDPNYALAYGNRGDAYHYKDDYDRAIADYSQVIKLDPNYALAYADRGAAYQSKGDYDRAIADYTQAIKLDSNYAYAYANRGDAYRYKDDYDRAIADYSQAIKLNSSYAFVYAGRGIVYHNKGDYDLAIVDLTQAIKLDPSSTFAYGNRGNAYYNKGDYDRAIADYSQAIKLNPNNAACYKLRGFAYYEKGQKNKAIADLEKAIQLDPNDQWAKDWLREVRGQ